MYIADHGQFDVRSGKNVHFKKLCTIIIYLHKDIKYIIKYYVNIRRICMIML